MKPRSSGRATSPLNRLAGSPAPFVVISYVFMLTIAPTFQSPLVWPAPGSYLLRMERGAQDTHKTQEAWIM